MNNVVYDCLEYKVVADENLFIEGYTGYRLEENEKATDKMFVIFKELDGSKDVEKRFVIMSKDMKEFIRLTKEYEDVVKREQYLFDSVVEIERKQPNNLKGECDDFYKKPENYIHFVAMNMVKSQYCLLTEKKIGA